MATLVHLPETSTTSSSEQKGYLIELSIDLFTDMTVFLTRADAEMALATMKSLGFPK